MLQSGLTPDSTVLDVGCGSLRLGNLLMRFLEPGGYCGINPRSDEIQQGLDFIVDPAIVARAEPRFSANGDFDLSVFGRSFDFVLASSVWSHTAKWQIQAMLDSFAQTAAPTSLLLASYVPASPVPDALRVPIHGAVRSIPGLPGRLRQWRGHVLGGPDYSGSTWTGDVISHKRRWLREQCGVRGLEFGEMKNPTRRADQIWARIRLR